MQTTLQTIPTAPYWISYTRISVDDGDGLIADKIERQRAINAKIVGDGVPVLHLSDEDSSGQYGKRGKSWRQAVRILEDDPRCLGIVVTWQDRLSRSVEDTAALVRICSENDKHVVIPTESIDTRATGWPRHIKNAFYYKSIGAQDYAEAVAEKLRAMVASVNDALLPWGKLPFGLRREGQGTKAFIVVSDDMPHAIRGLTIYAAGASYDDGIKKLNGEGVPFRARNGLPCQWTRESLRTVVGNVLIYAGYFLPKTVWDAKASRIKLEGTGTHLERYARACNAVKSPRIEQAISDALANAVIERRYRNQQVGRKSPAWTPLLTPIAWHRGAKLRAITRDFGRFYQTRRAGIMINGDDVDAFIVDRLSGLQFPPEMRAKVREHLIQTMSDAHVAALRERETTVMRKAKTLVSLLLEDRIERHIYNEQHDALQAELSAIRAELESPTEVERAMDMLADLGGMIKQMTPAARKRNVHRLLTAVHFDDDGEIERVELSGWALQAVRELASVYQIDNTTPTTPILPKVGIRDTISDATRRRFKWWMQAMTLAPMVASA